MTVSHKTIIHLSCYYKFLLANKLNCTSISRPLSTHDDAMLTCQAFQIPIIPLLTPCHHPSCTHLYLLSCPTHLTNQQQVPSLLESAAKTVGRVWKVPASSLRVNARPGGRVNAARRSATNASRPRARTEPCASTNWIVIYVLVP